MSPESAENVPILPRLFLFEPGWRIARKSNSEKEFCYTIAPGQDYYHRLLDGEVFLYRADEKVCLPCAARRGLLTSEPKTLREPIAGMDLAIEELRDGFEVIVREGAGPSAES